MTWTSIIFYGWTCACAGYVIGWFNGYYAPSIIISRHTENRNHG